METMKNIKANNEVLGGAASPAEPAKAPVSSTLSREEVEKEIKRLEAQYARGQGLLKQTQVDVLRIEGALVTLKALLASSLTHSPNGHQKGKPA